MALLFFDGFEGITAAQMSLRYAVVSGGIANSIANPPAPNGYAWYSSGGAQSGINITPNANTVIAGFRYMPLNVGQSITTAISMFNVQDDIGTVHVTAVLNLNGSISVYRGTSGGTLLGTTAESALLSPGVWSYFECKVLVDDSAGSVEIKINGTQKINLTSQDTRNGGNANISRVRFGAHVGSTAYSFVDDFYVADTTGSAPYNDYLGDVRVVQMLPDSAGDSTQWTPNAGNNWDRVDETPGHDGDATYVSDSTAGDTDLYNLSAPNTQATVIRAVKVISTARKADAGAQNLEILVKSGSTTSTSGSNALTDSYAEYSNTWLQNPDTTSDWTVADLTSLQSGFRIPV